MKELCKKIQEREYKLEQYLNFFTLEEIRTSPDYNVVRTLIKELSELYRDQEDKIYSHFKTK